ncbi:hypothetical protein AURDEDRAFT_172128 [Auricularia subglabra TFB-10046 SS5]|nr:hypothetical protein AURDEDRAFT_172128 [Auricularia subglabra TFB-10046 SS5]
MSELGDLLELLKDHARRNIERAAAQDRMVSSLQDQVSKMSRQIAQLEQRPRPSPVPGPVVYQSALPGSGGTQPGHSTTIVRAVEPATASSRPALPSSSHTSSVRNTSLRRTSAPSAALPFVPPALAVHRASAHPDAGRRTARRSDAHAAPLDDESTDDEEIDVNRGANASKYDIKVRGPRTQDVNDINAAIRSMVRYILKYKCVKAGRGRKVYSDFPPSPTAVDPPVELEGVSIVWEETNTSPYNARVIQLFAMRFGTEYQSYAISPIDLNQKIGRHINHLRKARMQLLFPPTVEEGEETRGRSNATGRKRQTSASRIQFIIDHGLLEYFPLDPQNQSEHIQFLFSPECTSSDELDTSFAPLERYRICRLPWRNEKLTEVLRLIDECIGLRGVGEAGRKARVRIDGDIDQFAKPRHQLPENWVSSSYLVNLGKFERKALLLAPKLDVKWVELTA